MLGPYETAFVGILLFSFGFFTLLSGLFTAYFGAGKSRAIGFVLSIVGVLMLLAFGVLTWPWVQVVEPIFDKGVIATTLVGVIGSAVGAVIALVLFLVSIMKA